LSGRGSSISGTERLPFGKIQREQLNTEYTDIQRFSNIRAAP
jgi:hypothetical protein